MQKFNRNYRIEFEIGTRLNLSDYNYTEKIEIKYPFTLHLDINRGIFAAANTGNFEILNLALTTQAKLWKDRSDQKKAIRMTVYAGYGDFMPLIFVGDVQQCYSYRDSGATETITAIEATDAGYLFQYGFANVTMAKDTKAVNMLQSLMANVPTVNIGYVSPDIKDLPRTTTYVGSIMDLLTREYSNFDVFVDNGEIHILGENDIIPGQMYVINSDSGLLGSPKRSDTFLEVDMIFEPGLTLTQAIRLESYTLPFMNNNYKLVGIRHYGSISPVEAGNLYTTVTLSLGEYAFNELQKAIQTTESGSSTSGQWDKPIKNARVSSGFGPRKQPTKGSSYYHKGLDLAANAGTPIYAPANGTVIATNREGGYGFYIIINHGTIDGKKVTSLYAHMPKWEVAVNQKVSQGQLIGHVGSTGNSTGPHCHFAIYENNIPVDPTKYIGKY